MAFNSNWKIIRGRRLCIEFSRLINAFTLYNFLGSSIPNYCFYNSTTTPDYLPISESDNFPRGVRLCLVIRFANWKIIRGRRLGTYLFIYLIASSAGLNLIFLCFRC